jgi:hypothetical protein
MKAVKRTSAGASMSIYARSGVERRRGRAGNDIVMAEG